MTNDESDGPFPTIRDDYVQVPGEDENLTAQNASPAYRLAFVDEDFMLRPDLRAVRLQLELLKPELLQQEQGIRSTIAMFGSARISDPETALAKVEKAETAARSHPRDKRIAHELTVARRMLANSRYYEEARRLAGIVSGTCSGEHVCDFVVKTGGGPGIMEAANRGAFEIGGKTIGLNIVLPHEQAPNPYITPELCFRFHYFAIRKMHFMIRVKALVVFPGGFGTMDELFEALTLIQTRKIEPIPVIMFGREYWERVINFDAMAMEGMIGPDDKDLLTFVETAEEAWNHIADFYRLPR
ncbi:MAG: LOG family protein [Magnetospirillum sp.]